MNKRILIVGGAGYIGGAITDILLKTDCDVRIYDKLLYEEHYRKPVDFIYGDIRDREKLKRHLEWAEAVIWLAALVADGSCALYPELGIEFNQKSVEWLAQNFMGRIIFPSTCLVYKIQAGLLNEESATEPQTIYTKTKLAAEGYLRDSNAIIFRLGTVFGLGDAFSRMRLDLVVNLLTARAAIDGKMIVFGGKQFRPFIHVRDVAQAIVDNLETEHTGVSNLHWDNLQILDLAQRVQKYIPNAEIEIKEALIKDTGDYKINGEKARRILGFNPHYSVEDGIAEIKAVIEGGRLKDIRNPRYSNEKFLKNNPPK